MARNRTSRLRAHAAAAGRAMRDVARALERIAAELRQTPRIVGVARTGRRPKRALGPKARAFRKLQGQYLGLVRHLPAKHKAAVKALRAKKGYRAAINSVRQLVGGRKRG